MKIRQLRKDQDAGSDDGAAASRRVTPAGGEHVTGARNDPPPHRYRIRVRGHLGQTTRGAFPALQARNFEEHPDVAAVIAQAASFTVPDGKGSAG